MRALRASLVGLVLCTFTLLNLYILLNNSNVSDCSRCPSRKDQSDQVTSEENVTIFFITPTYARPVQKAELTRLSHTLLLVRNIHWIVIEDAHNRTKLVASLLNQAYQRQMGGFAFTHLNVATPSSFKTTETDPNWLKPRGVWQRNAAIRWLREHRHSSSANGVVYFGDDDNTYDLKLFDEIRRTTKVSVFPVGLVGGLRVERPLVKAGKVVGFNSVWKPNRKYPIDMAGFALNLGLLVQMRDALFSENVARGLQESHLLNQLVDSWDELEPMAHECRQTLVWHTRTENAKLRQERKLKVPSNLGMLDD